MYNARLVDFLFTGLAVLPGALLFAGHVGPALLLFVPLLIGACLTSLYQQEVVASESAAEEAADDPALTLTGAGRWGEHR